MDKIEMALFAGMFIFIAFIIWVMLTTTVFPDYQTLEITHDDIILEGGNFYLRGPEGSLVELPLDHATYDFRNSTTYVRFQRMPFNRWVFKGIIKL